MRTKKKQNKKQQENFHVMIERPSVARMGVDYALGFIIGGLGMAAAVVTIRGASDAYDRLYPNSPSGKRADAAAKSGK